MRTPLPVLLVLPLLAGCQDEGPVIEVSVTGLSTGVRALEVWPSYEGRTPDPAAQTVSSRLDSFLLRPGTPGTLVVHVAGLDVDGCPLREGAARLTVARRERAAVTIALGAPSAPACQLQVRPLGKG